MKRILSFLFVILMLFSASAFADDGIYMRELPQEKYSHATVFSPETYPEVCISAFPAIRILSKYYADPVFVCFPFPENVLASSFDEYSVHALNTTRGIQYNYEVKESYSWEEFLNRAEKEEYIIQKGDNGIAIYIAPESKDAYAMMATEKFGKTSKLLIKIRLDELGKNTAMDKIISALTEEIKNEANRVKEQMHYETIDPYWNKNTYIGFKLIDDYDYTYMIKLTFPDIYQNLENGQNQKADLFIKSSKDKYYRLLYLFDEDHYINAEITMINSSFVADQFEKEKNPDAQKVTLKDGTEWYVYARKLVEDGQSGWIHFALPLNHKDHNNKNFYLEITLQGTHYSWSSNEEIIDLLNLFANNYEILDANDDPYIPGESKGAADSNSNKPTEKQNPIENNEWTCPECGTINDKNFCAECGIAKPETTEWVCPECGTINDRNFCAECGIEKPEVTEWTCPNCGAINNKKFCPECGTVKP